MLTLSFIIWVLLLLCHGFFFCFSLFPILLHIFFFCLVKSVCASFLRLKLSKTYSFTLFDHLFLVQIIKLSFLVKAPKILFYITWKKLFSSIYLCSIERQKIIFFPPFYLSIFLPSHEFTSLWTLIFIYGEKSLKFYFFTLFRFFNSRL